MINSIVLTMKENMQRWTGNNQCWDKVAHVQWKSGKMCTAEISACHHTSI